MESSNESFKCRVCGESATVNVSGLELTDGSSKQLFYCSNHAKEDAIIGAYVPEVLNLAEDRKKQLEEVLGIVRSTGKIPLDVMTLPSGAINPF